MDKRKAVPYTTHETKYLKFVVVRFKPKTMVVAVASKSSGEELGRIEWFSRWRQYCFMPNGMTVWNTDCLTDIQNFITAIQMSRAPKPKTVGVICKDMQDFLQWSRKKKHKRPAGSTINKYIHRTTTYIGITRLTHTCGYTLDKIVETDLAPRNSHYNQLKDSAETCLRAKST